MDWRSDKPLFRTPATPGLVHAISVVSEPDHEYTAADYYFDFTAPPNRRVQTVTEHGEAARGGWSAKSGWRGPLATAMKEAHARLFEVWQHEQRVAQGEVIANLVEREDHR